MKLNKFNLSEIIFILIIFSSLLSCTKEKGNCWQAFDPSGIDVTGLQICDKSKSQAEAAYPQYWFYNSTETKYCWRVQTQQGTTLYMPPTPTSMIDMMRPYGNNSFTKVDCNSFCKWKIIEKSQSKISGQYAPEKVIIETFGTTDTCSHLFTGKTVVFRETSDSLITRLFSEKQ